MVFTRRAIQERLNTISKIVGKRKLRQIVKILNVEGNESNNKRILESLAWTWEVAVVASFCKLGNTKYEMPISNGKRPDIFFDDHEISLLCDVFTVSDDQQHRKNPVEEFSRILTEIWKKFGPEKGTLSWQVESIDINPPSPPKISAPYKGPIHLSSRLRPINRRALTRLLLPPIDDMEKYLYSKIPPFFRKLRLCPTTDSLKIDEQYDTEKRVCFSIQYSPEGYSMLGSYGSYTSIKDIERHVLWRRLEEKRNQFAGATEECPRILIVCDGGCDALKVTATASHDYSFQEVLDHFWRNPSYSAESGWFWTTETGISAVLVLSVESNWKMELQKSRNFELKSHLFLNPYCQFPLTEDSFEFLEKVVSCLPTPVESPSNVLRFTNSNPMSTRHLGFFTMSQKHVKISAVTLLRILSGELSLEEFCRQYKLNFNPFKNALMGFQTIKKISLKTVPNRDDDMIIIEFGMHDTAIGPFKVPDSGE